MELGLEGKRVIVGGASSGLGLAIAQMLAVEGAKVVMIARRSELLEAEAQKIGATGVAADLSVPADLHRLVRIAVEANGGIDALVWNTGGPPAGAAIDIDADSLQATFSALFIPLVQLVELVLPHLRESSSGRLLAITAAGAKEPDPRIALSNAIRPGIVGYLKSLASELAPAGITVNCLAPARVFTSRLAQIYPDGPPPELAKQVPMGRLGTPDEFAAVACFLLSERASYVTGTTVTVDGGLSRTLF